MIKFKGKKSIIFLFSKLKIFFSFFEIIREDSPNFSVPYSCTFLFFIKNFWKHIIFLTYDLNSSRFPTKSYQICKKFSAYKIGASTVTPFVITKTSLSRTYRIIMKKSKQDLSAEWCTHNGRSISPAYKMTEQPAIRDTAGICH